MKIKLALLQTILFFIFQTSVLFAQNPTAPAMDSTTNFLLFTSAGAVSNSGSTSIYAGNIGTNGAGDISGFQTLQTQPFGLFNSNSETAQCAADLATLYSTLLNRPANTQTSGVYGGTLSTLTSGIYHSATAASIAGNLTLDGENNPDARFIIQSDGAFTMAASTKIILINGAKAKNVFWVITGAASFAANAEAKGTFICTGAISLGASFKLEGGILTTAGAITGDEGMTLSSSLMLLKESQTIYSGAMPSDLVLTGNSNPVVKWESATDINFTNPININYYSASLAGSCIGPLTTTIYYRVVVLIDGINVNSNIIKITVINSPTVPDMGASNAFVLFTKTGDITNTGTSTNNAFIGTNAGAITGFTDTSLLHTQDLLTQNTGIYLQTLFDSISSIPNTSNHIAAFGAGEILLPGVYFMGSAATIGGILTLDGKGSPDSVFIIKIKGAFAFAANTKIILTNGAAASNVFWIIDGGLDVGAFCEARGNFICLAGAIALGNDTLTEGKFITITGDITLENCTLSTSIIATSNQIITSGESPQGLILIGTVDTIVKWQKSTDILFSNVIDIINTTNSLSSADIGTLSSTTYFRAIVTIGTKIINSTIVTIGINLTTNPGIISANQEFCSPSQPADLILSGNRGLIIKWQSALNSDFTSPTDIMNTTNTLTGIAIGIVPVTTFYRAVVQNCTCPVEYAIPIKILIASLTTWDGTSWSNGLPSSSKSVIFSGDYNANENIDACSITVNNGAVVVINSGFTMTLTNELTISGGTLTFENNASLVQINNVTNIGNITYNRNTTMVLKTDYTYWSTPVSPQTLGVISPTSGLFYSFDLASNNWIQQNESTIMSNGIGYIIRGPQANLTPAVYTASFFGVPNNGDITTCLYPITSAALGSMSSVLLGNPYPSALDADLLISSNPALEGTLYFWTHNTSIQLATNINNGTAGSGNYAYTSDDYAVYNRTGGIAATPSTSNMGVINDNIPSGKIAAGQGFFAEIMPSGGTITFNNNMRVGVSGNNSQFFKSATINAENNGIEKNRIWLDLANTQGAFKQTLVGYISGATNNFDNGYDGLSHSENQFIDFYSIQQDNNLVIQGKALPFNINDEVPLGFRTNIDGVFTIAINHVDGLFTNQSIFLQDNLTNTITDLKNSDYTFNTSVGIFNNRFVLLYTNGNLGTEDFNTQHNSVLVSIKNKQISIISTTDVIDEIFLYDISGKEIYQKANINNNKLLISDLTSNHEVLLMKTILKNKKVVNTKILY